MDFHKRAKTTFTFGALLFSGGKNRQQGSRSNGTLKGRPLSKRKKYLLSIVWRKEVIEIKGIYIRVVQENKLVKDGGSIHLKFVNSLEFSFI